MTAIVDACVFIIIDQLFRQRYLIFHQVITKHNTNGSFPTNARACNTSMTNPFG